MITTATPPRSATVGAHSRDYISFSEISTYRGCPLRHHFRYVLGLPEPTVSASLVFGRAIHQAVEHHFNELLAGNEPPTIDSLQAEYDRAWSETDCGSVNFGKDDDLSRLNQLAQRMLAAFQGSAIAQPQGSIIGVEEELRGSTVPGCPDLLGRVDLLLESPAAVTIVDLKTSRSRWSAEQVDDQAEQLLLYSELSAGSCPASHCDCSSRSSPRPRNRASSCTKWPTPPRVWSELGSPCVASGVPSRVTSFTRPHRSWAVVAARFESLVVSGRDSVDA